MNYIKDSDCEWKRVKKDNYISFSKEIELYFYTSPEGLLSTCGALTIWDDKFEEHVCEEGRKSKFIRREIVFCVQDFLDTRSRSIVGRFYAC